MQQTLEQHTLSRFTISDIRPKLKFDSREPDVMAEVTFYLNKYNSYNKALTTLLSMRDRTDIEVHDLNLLKCFD